MPADTPFNPQNLYNPSKAEVENFTGVLSSWMNLEMMRAEIQAIEERAKWNVHIAPQFKIVREARQAVDFASFLQKSILPKDPQIEALKMSPPPSAWPDFWLRMKGEEFPCELTTIHIPDDVGFRIPIHRNEDGELILDGKTDYSEWSQDQFIEATPHAGRWRGAVGKALRGGHKTPLGTWPQGEIINHFPEWTEKAVRDKNNKAQEGNYLEGTVLVIMAEFEIMVDIPFELMRRLDAAMKLGTAFRAVFLHVPNKMCVAWDNPAFPPFPWG